MTSLEWTGNAVRFLDQSKLPLDESYVETTEYRVVGDAIRQLRIRGAPAIGVAAAFALLLAVRKTSIASAPDLIREFTEAERFLSGTRPTAVNLFVALRRMRSTLEHFSSGDLPSIRSALQREAMAIQSEDIDACRRIGDLGAMLLAPGSTVLTHCNTGALATAGSGTALSIIMSAARIGRVSRVFVDETRPLLQGARLTSWELLRAGIEATLITDSSAGTVLQRQGVQAVLVGADRIAANGDTANKIGTYPLAVLASRHRVPFYVAAPTSTIDHGTPTGEQITIEERDAGEVTHIGGIRIAPEGVGVYAPAFDVTPNELITAIVTEKGVLRPPFTAAIAGLRPPAPRPPRP